MGLILRCRPVPRPNSRRCRPASPLCHRIAFHRRSGGTRALSGRRRPKRRPSPSIARAHLLRCRPNHRLHLTQVAEKTSCSGNGSNYVSRSTGLAPDSRRPAQLLLACMHTDDHCVRTSRPEKSTDMAAVVILFRLCLIGGAAATVWPLGDVAPQHPTRSPGILRHVDQPQPGQRVRPRIAVSAYSARVSRCCANAGRRRPLEADLLAVAHPRTITD